MSFKSRYLNEAETGQTISNEINKASDFAGQNNKRETAQPTSGISQASTIVAPEQSLVKANEAVGDLGKNATPDDANKVDRVLTQDRLKTDKLSSQTPFNNNINPLSLGESTQINEANLLNGIDLEARIPGRFDNKLSKKMKDAGLNTGVTKVDISVRTDASKSGQKNITQGTKASFTLGKHDMAKQAKDGLKTPKKDDINKATVITAGAYLKIGALVEEYTSLDVEKTGKIPGNRDQSQTFKGVQPGYHQGASAKQTAAMNEITDDKMKRAAGNRSMTAPEDDNDPKMGLHIERSNIVHGADAQNAETSAAREKRLSGGEE